MKKARNPHIGAPRRPHVGKSCNSMKTSVFEGRPYSFPIRLFNANAVIAELAFHPRGWLNQQIMRGPNDAVTTDDQITTFDNDARGNLTKVTSPDGSFATLTYDGRDQ